MDNEKIGNCQNPLQQFIIDNYLVIEFWICVQIRLFQENSKEKQLRPHFWPHKLRTLCTSWRCLCYGEKELHYSGNTWRWLFLNHRLHTPIYHILSVLSSIIVPSSCALYHYTMLLLLRIVMGCVLVFCRALLLSFFNTFYFWKNDFYLKMHDFYVMQSWWWLYLPTRR